MTVEAEISEADIGTVKVGMPVYFTTLGGGDRRWYGTLRQILPTPTVTNNVVLYTGLFDVENSDNALFSEMTAQVYFITSAAQNVLTVPVGALTYTEQAVPALAAAGAATVNAEGASAPGAGGPPPGFVPGAGGPPPGFVPGQGRPPGGFGGGAGRPGGRRAALAAAEPGVPRNATVTVVKDDGTREDRNVTVGVTSRVAAEVLSGLTVGEQVVAGILQANAPAAPAQQGGFPGGGFPGGGGGFRGGF
jgi:macrolide-specific efflux system membrane fusion protein